MSPLSDKRFGAALRELMEARGLTYGELAQATRDLDARGMTSAHINMLANGHDRPSRRAMTLIAQACGMTPDYFAEYRLAEARRELDPVEVGHEQALENLKAQRGGHRQPGAWSISQPAPQAQPRPGR